MVEELTNAPAPASETVRAFVDVSKKPRSAVALAWCLVAILMTAATVWGLSVGNLYSVVVLIPLVYVTGFAKRAAAATETRIVWVTMTVSGGNLIIDMPGGRLYNGEYVDQRYVCNNALIDSVIFDGQVFRLRAQSMQSVVFRAGVQLALENLMYMEVSFRLDADGGQRIGRLLAENGYVMSPGIG